MFPAGRAMLIAVPESLGPPSYLFNSEGERAKKMENPTTRGPIESAARRYATLAEKLEAARRRQAR
jgi:hypothetical protein